MKRHIKKLSFALGGALFLISPLVASTDSPIETHPRTTLAQGVVMGIGTRNIWKNLQNPRQRDMLYEPLSSSDSLVYQDNSTSLVFTRAGKLCYGIGDMLKLDIIGDVVGTFISSKLFNELEPAPLEDEEDLDEYQAALAAWEAEADAVAVSAQTCTSTIMESIKQITFQEHRLGAVLNKEWLYDRCVFSARTWIGVAERNYWLDDVYRQGFAAAAKRLFPSNDGTFNLSDFVTTSWGMGDLHLKGGLVTPLARGFELRTGIKVILPTATENRRPTYRQTIPLTADSFQGYGRTRLNEVFIAPKLGNGGHFGGGVWSDFTWKQRFFHDEQELTVKTYGGVDYLIPGTEERLLMQYPTGMVANTTLMASFIDGDDDAQYRAFIGQYILPEPASVIVAPGAVIQLGGVVQYNFGHALLFAGYDWYSKSREKITGFVFSNDARLFSPVEELDPLVSNQQKIFGGISYNTVHHDITLFSVRFPQVGVSYGIQGAATTVASGLGDDFSVGLGFGIKC